MEKKIEIEKEFGICVKNQDKTVLYQNDLCKSICTDMTGKVCDKGCMQNFTCALPTSAVEGMSLIKNSHMNDRVVDAVVINNGDNLTTLLYPLDKKYDYDQEQLAIFKKFGLTKSEINIFQKVIRGESNSEIAKSLFVSKATIKTHLNNIYKKLPKEWHVFKSRH